MKRLLLGTILAFACAVASAQNTGLYAGVHLGQATVDEWCDVFSGVSCEDTDTSWRILAGYQVNQNLAFELGYANLGEVDARGPGGFATAEVTAFDLTVVGALPIAERFAVYGKIGLYRAETEFRSTTIAGVLNADEKNTDLTFGVGLRFDVTRQLGARVEWQRYGDVGGGGLEADVDVISVGLLYRF